MGRLPNEDARVLIQEVGVGGIIYYDWCKKLHTLNEIQALSSGLQKLAKYPLLIAADHEGERFYDLERHSLLFPGSWAIGELGRRRSKLLVHIGAMQTGKKDRDKVKAKNQFLE